VTESQPALGYNPAGLHLPWSRRLRYFPIQAVFGALAMALLTYALAEKIHAALFNRHGLTPQLLVLAVVATAGFIAFWYGARRHFIIGDLNPAVVVSVNPPLAAVFTDLGKQPPYPAYPIIKVVSVRLSGRDGEPPPQVGEKLVVVSVYFADARPGAPAWANINPIPAYVATGDPQTHRALAEHLGESQWDELNAYLSQVRKPYRKGLFRLRPRPTSNLE
jgi:hypothetical protein